MYYNIIRLEEVDSTNNYLRSVALVDEEQMLVAVARHQTAGRGQGRNTWESEAGKNLLFSVKIKPRNIAIANQFLLSMTMALAIKHALDKRADGFSLKWPNDIYWHDYKISGTLIETTLSGSAINSCIFGIGIDVNQKTFLSDAPNPLSLCSITGHSEDCDWLLSDILQSFDSLYSQLTDGDSHTIITQYHDALYRHTGFYTYRDKSGEFQAEIVRVEPNGRLVLSDTESQIRQYYFKEVAFVL